MATVSTGQAAPAIADAPLAASPIATKKFKASDLPLPSATRGAIESLAHSFKKKGDYDAIRKQLWDEFKANVRLPPFFAFVAIWCSLPPYRTTKIKSLRLSSK